MKAESWSNYYQALTGRPPRPLCAFGGVLAAQLFGEHDSWASQPTLTFHTRTDVHRLLEPFEIKVLREVEEDGQAVSGPKHWHVFHLIARKDERP